MAELIREWAASVFLVNQAFFVVTFVAVWARAMRERRRSDLDTALLFGVMALVLVLSSVVEALDIPDAQQTAMFTPLILAVPYLMLRLVADFAAVPWWALRLAELAFFGQLIFSFVAGTLPFAAVSVYAAIPIAWSAIAFVREARRARGVTRRRYTAIAVGTGAVVASLLLTGLAYLVFGRFPGAIDLIVQLCVLAAGASFFVGFATPSWLRALWREPDLRSFLARVPGELALADADTLVRELARNAREAIGSEGALIGVTVGTDRIRFRGTGADYEAPLGRTFAGRAIRAGRALASLDPIRDVPEQADLYRSRQAAMLIAAPIRIGDEVLGALTARRSHVSLFASDDLEICQLLADQIALVLKNRALADERQWQAEHDSLTGLPHIYVLYRRLGRRLADRTAAGPTALVLMGMDAFAEVNQTFGHPAGDEVLAEIARRMSAIVPPDGLLARWGGDQLGVLIPGGAVADAEALARRMLVALERPFTVGDDEIECGASIGIAVHPDHAADARGLLAAAEVSLALAKRTANTYAVYPLEAEPHRARHHALRADLRRAIADGSIRVEYQPLVSMRSGALLRLEALARWDHPQHGPIPPSAFVELAERTGLIRPLTGAVMRQALADAKAWRRWLPQLRVAVNVSARTFADAGLVALIGSACSEAGCDPDALGLEITESVLMAEPEHARGTVARLREMGVTTEIDDFGTGYSSLAYLHRLPVSGLKIDRQFIAAMSADERSDAIVRATIRLSHELGFEVAAEGIADRRLWDLLAATGCDVGQGFFIAQSMPADAVRGWLSSWLARVPRRAEPFAVEPPAGAGPRVLVLVVDDDPSIVSVVRDVLSEHGYAVATASDGQEALDLIERRRPDAVLLDVHMPIMDGEAFAASLRDRRVEIPLVVTTSGPNAQRWAERIGAHAYLAKPFAIDDLLAATRRAMEGGAPALQ